MIDFENLEKMIAERYISRQKHPNLDLYIHNYTQKTQFDRMWNNETLQCRGLIMDGQNNIVSRPFSKFFNLGELEGKDIAIPDGDFTVTEKMDGSLGISYFDPDGRMFIATRGSFVSDQAKRANEIWRLEYEDVVPAHKDLTFLFEIIYPENRIVVDYGDAEDLVLLTIIDTKTGKEWEPWQLNAASKEWGIPVVKYYDGITDFNQVEERPNAEGYVIHYPSTGLRFKLKFNEYVRLHKIITGVNKKRVWEFLKENQPLDAFLERVPDEFYKWIVNTATDLGDGFRVIEEQAIQLWAKTKSLSTRKDQAIAIKDSPYRGIVFNILDGKPYDQIIWKMLEPEFDRPFKVEI